MRLFCCSTANFVDSIIINFFLYPKAHELKKLGEVGIQDILSKRHNVPEPNCEPIYKKGQSLGMEKFASIFVLYLIGLIFSLIIVILENVFKPRKLKTPTAYNMKFESLQTELENLAAEYGMKISGDVRSGCISFKDVSGVEPKL